MRSSSSLALLRLGLEPAPFFVFALLLGCRFRREALALFFFVALLRLGLEPAPFFVFALLLGCRFRREALALFFFVALLRLGLDPASFFFFALLLGCRFRREALALFFFVALLRLGLDPASFFFFALLLGCRFRREALALFFFVALLRLGLDPASFFFFALLLGRRFRREALALFFLGVGFGLASQAIFLFPFPLRGRFRLEAPLFFFLTLALLLALTLGGRFCLFRRDFFRLCALVIRVIRAFYLGQHALTECLDARVCRRCRCGLDGWRTLDWLRRSGPRRVCTSPFERRRPGGSLCIGRGGLDDVFGGRGRVRRSIAQGEAKCSGRRVLALASKLVSARDERDNFLSERVRVAPGDRRRGLLLVLAESAEEATAADRVLVRLRRDELRDRVRLDVTAAVQRSQFFEQVVLVRRREKC